AAAIALCSVQRVKPEQTHGQGGCPLSFRFPRRRSKAHHGPATRQERIRAKISLAIQDLSFGYSRVAHRRNHSECWSSSDKRKQPPHFVLFHGSQLSLPSG